MNFFIPILVGATIGYITNWLAIKMLFRPYERKYIFGIPIPFTPGLIPKEQKRISKSVGDAVGDYLLTEDIIMENIKKGNIEEKIEIYIIEYINSLKNNDINIRELIDKLNIEEYEKIKNNISDKISFTIFNYLKNNKKDFLEKINFEIENINYNEKIKELRILFERELNKISDSEELEKIIFVEINNIIEKYKNDNRKLKELVNEEKTNRFVENNSHHIVDIVRKSVNDISMEHRIKNILNNIVEENVSKAILLFTGTESIVEKIYNALINFINNEDFDENIKLILKTGLNSFMDNSIANIYSGFEKDLNQDNIERMSIFFKDKIFSENNNKKIMDNIEDIFSKKEDIIIDSLKNKIEEYYDNLIENDKFRYFINNEILNIVDNISNIKINKILNNIEEDKLNLIVSKIKDIIINLINKKLPIILSKFDISKIVEEEINSFEVDFAEEIILEIASKELKAITWLGALLGGIMGILTPIMQRI